MFNTKLLAIICKVATVAWTVVLVLWGCDSIYAAPYSGSFSAGLGYAVGIMIGVLLIASIFYVGFACAYKYLVGKD